MKITIYHNPRCSKSREACELIVLHRPDIEIIEYLKTPPSPAGLKKILKLLGMKPSQLVRTKEPLYKEKFERKRITESQWLTLLCKNPILIERPIVIKGNKAIIARPPERITEFLEAT